MVPKQSVILIVGDGLFRFTHDAFRNQPFHGALKHLDFVVADLGVEFSCRDEGWYNTAFRKGINEARHKGLTFSK